MSGSVTAVRNSPGPRDRDSPATAIPTTAKGRRTRRDLLDAAKTLFVERGYNSTRISDIAAFAGTSYGAFYHYFASKEAVAAGIFNEMSGEILAASYTNTRSPQDPIVRIRDANRRYLQAAYQNRELIAILEELALDNEVFRGIKLRIRTPYVRRNAAGIAKLQRSGLADSSLDPDLTASMLGGMVEYMTHLWFIHEEPYDEDEAVLTLTRLWANALRLPSE